jgi:tetratricopeptide (TPR) repeat protein
MKCSWGARAVSITLVLCVAYTRADAADASVSAARDLFAQFVFPEHAQSHDRLEALAHVARLIDRAEHARAVLPLYRRALASSRVTGDEVGRALAEGYAACLRKQRHPLVQVVRSLRRESAKAGTPAARDGLVAVAERLHGIVTERSDAGRGRAAEAVAVPRRAARVRAPAIGLGGGTARAQRGKPLAAPAGGAAAAHPQLPLGPAGGSSAARPKPHALIEGNPAAARAAVAPLARVEAFALGARSEELRVSRRHAAVEQPGLAVQPSAPLPQPRPLEPAGKAPVGPERDEVALRADVRRAAEASNDANGLKQDTPRPKAPHRLRAPEVAGRAAPPSLSGAPRAARPAASEIPIPGQEETRAASTPQARSLSPGGKPAARPKHIELALRAEPRRAEAAFNASDLKQDPARPKAPSRIRTPEVAGRTARPSLSAVSRVARPASSEIPIPGKGDTRLALAPPIEAPSEKAGRAREAAAEAGSAALQTLVKSLLDKADWKARKGKHQEALDLLGTVIHDARNSAASAQAVRRALPLSLAGLKGQDREAMLEEFEPWVARLGGELDRERAKVLVLQQRYRNGAFARARDGLEAFLAERPQSDLAPRASLLLGLATWRAGDRKASIRGLRELVEQHPKHEVAPRALFLVGYLHFANGEREPATKAFLRVARDYPDSPFADRAVEFLGGEAAKRAEAEAEEEQ